MSENTQTEATLDLAQPRTVVLTAGDHQFVLRCRRITDADWAAFFAGVTVTNEYQGGDLIKVFEAEAPQLVLAESVLIGAEGYTVDGGEDLLSLPEWQKRIPLAHRLLLGATLSSARPSMALDDGVIAAEGEVISLDATWSAVNKIEGGSVMRRFSGLKHIFSAPSQEQHLRYKREGSRVRVVGGSRTGKTIFPGASGLLAKLYDELIQSVDGYCFSGVPFSGRDQIVHDMDMHHKVMAAQDLFEPRSGVRLAGD